MSKKIETPSFKNEDEERDFWANIDLSDHLAATDLDSVSLPNLKPTTRPVSIRFPEYVIDAVKVKANEMGVPYQTLIKQVVAEAFLE